MIRISTTKEITRLSIPTILALSSSTVMGIVNLILIRNLDFNNTAVVGLANMFSQNVIILIVSFSFQVTIMVSNFIGANKGIHVNKVGKDALWATFLFNAPIVIVCMLLCEPIMRLLGASEEMLRIGKIYFTIRIASIFFISISRTLIGFLRGLEKTKVAMYTTMLANMLNISIGFVAIHYLKLGLLGIAVSIVLSEIVQILVLYRMLKRHGYCFSNNILSFDIQNTKKIYKEGVKIGIQDIGLSLTTVFFTIFAARLGAQQLAATEVALNLLSLAYLPGIAIGVTASTEVAKLVGQRKKTRDDFSKLRKNLLIVSARFTGPLCLIGGIGGGMLSLAFTNDGNVRTYITQILFLAMFFLLFDAFQMVLMDGDRGFGNNTNLMYIALGLGLLFFVPFCYIITFVFDFGLLGMWFSFYIYISIQFYVLFRDYTKQANRCCSNLEGGKVPFAKESGDQEGC